MIDENISDAFVLVLLSYINLIVAVLAPRL